MNVENTDVETTLLKSECYICLETCLQKSPCECASHVHPKCLIHFVEMSGNTQCTICTGQYPVPPPPPPPKLSLTPHKIMCTIGLSLTSFQSREEELQAMYEGHPLNHSLQREIEQGNLGFLLRRPK